METLPFELCAYILFKTEMETHYYVEAIRGNYCPQDLTFPKNSLLFFSTAIYFFRKEASYMCDWNVIDAKRLQF